MSHEFEEIYTELKDYLRIALPEMHRLIALCDLAEARALEVLARCQ